MNWMLMNHTHKQEAAYIQYKMTIEQDRKLTSVKPFWLDVAKCHGGSIFNNPGSDIGGANYHQKIPWKVPFDGRIVNGGAHLHGGARDMQIKQPSCGNRTLLTSHAVYGMPDDPVYEVRPILHEPGPISSTVANTPTGIPIRRGDKLYATTTYENSMPHAAAMAMLHVYVARSKAPAEPCPALPTDVKDQVENISPDAPTRADPPRFPVPLVGIGPDGKWRNISRPPGKVKRLAGSSTIVVRGFDYRPRNLSIPVGSTLTWRFPDSVLHNVTLATGPVGFASLHLSSGAAFKQRLTRKGTYKLYCSLHPTQMHELVTVR
jgi:plastocyanin